MRRKEKFGNNRMCKWIENTQEYDFSAEHRRREELVIADSLSRLYEEERNKL
jgi:hypothetical protein